MKKSIRVNEGARVSDLAQMKAILSGISNEVRFETKLSIQNIYIMSNKWYTCIKFQKSYFSIHFTVLDWWLWDKYGEDKAVW